MMTPSLDTRCLVGGITIKAVMNRKMKNGSSVRKNVLKMIHYFCDAPKPGGPVDHRQPEEAYVSHVMRPIYE